MNQRTFVFLVAAGVMLTWVDPGFAADPSRGQSEVQAQGRIYGSPLMTLQERAEFRTRMLGAGTPEEQERIRRDHHQEMEKRAREQGITLIEESPEREMGLGLGPGRGRGGHGR